MQKDFSVMESKDIKKLTWKFARYYRESNRTGVDRPLVSLAVSLYALMPERNEKSFSFGPISLSVSSDKYRESVLDILKQEYHDLTQIYSDDEIKALKENFRAIVENGLNFFNQEVIERQIATFGQPHQLTDLCVECANFQDGSRIYNPFCGMASYPIAIKNCTFEGEELNPYCWALSQILIYAAGINADIKQGDSFKNLSVKQNIYDGVIMTPPFGLKGTAFASRQNEYSAVLDALNNKLKDNGTLVVVLPASFMFSTSGSQQMLKSELLEKGYLKMVVSLPHQLFYPYAGVSTCLIVINKKSGEDVLLVDGSSFVEKSKENFRDILKVDDLMSAIKASDEKSCARVSNRTLLQESLLSPILYMHPFKQNGTKTVSLEEVAAPFNRRIMHTVSNGGTATCRYISIQNLKFDTDCTINVDSLEEKVANPHNKVVPANSLVLLPSVNGLRMGYVGDYPENAILACSLACTCIKSTDISIPLEFLMVQLQSEYVKDQVSRLIKSFGRGDLPWTYLKRILIHCPSKEEQDKIVKEYYQSKKAEAEKSAKSALEFYMAEIHSRKHAMSQTLSALSAQWNKLNRFRQKNNGQLTDNDIVSPTYNRTVADIFDSITHRLNTLLVQTDNLADVEYNWGKEEIITPRVFIHKYIQEHKDVRCLMLEDNYDLTSTESSDVLLEENPEELVSIIIPTKALERVFDNIVANAISHGFTDSTRSDYKIRFTEEFVDNDQYIIRIANNGNPIPENVDTKDIFVYGFSTALNEKGADGKEHSGIGGYDTRNILRDYNASIEVISTPELEYTVTYVLTFTKTNIDNE